MRTNRGALRGRGRRSPPSSPTQRVRSTTAGRCTQWTWRRTTTRLRGSGRCISEGRVSWLRSTVLRSVASSSYGGTTSRIWSARSRRRQTFPTEDAERSLWAGETGIRLVLQRLAPSQANLERLSELIAANERDERCELMWGSPGTILAGRELGLDVTASVEWLQRPTRRGRPVDAAPLWVQRPLPRSGTRVRGLRARARRCRGRLGDAPALRRRGGRARQLASVRRDDAARRDTATVRSACSGATAPRGSLRRSATCSTRNLQSREPS